MHTVALCVAALSLGVEYGWQPAGDGQLEYIIQLEPALLEALREGEEITSEIPAEARGVRRFRIRVGEQDVPRIDAPIPEPAEQPASEPSSEPTPPVTRSSASSPDRSPPPDASAATERPEAAAADGGGPAGAPPASTDAAEAPGSAPTRAGRSRPDVAGPDVAGPDIAGPDETGPDGTGTVEMSADGDRRQEVEADRHKGASERVAADRVERPGDSSDSSISQPSGSVYGGAPSAYGAEAAAADAGASGSEGASLAPPLPGLPSNSSPYSGDSSDAQYGTTPAPEASAPSTETTASSELDRQPGSEPSDDASASQRPGSISASAQRPASTGSAADQAAPAPLNPDPGSEPLAHMATAYTEAAEPSKADPPSAGEERGGEADRSSQLEGKQDSRPTQPAKPWMPLTLTALALFASLGGNAYLGWICWGFYWRYRDLAEDVRHQRMAARA